MIHRGSAYAATRGAFWLAVLGCVVLYGVHLSYVWRYAVDAPFQDEWAMFTPGQLPAGFSLASITSPHNEHRFATTKAFIFLQYHWNGWDLAVHQRLNFLLFGILLAVVSRWTLATARGVPVWLVVAFVPFLLTPSNWLNHFMGFQSNLHFYVIFLFLSVSLLFGERQSWLSLSAAAASVVATTYSSAAGLVAATTVVCVFAAFKIGRSVRHETRRARELVQLAVILAVTAAALAFWRVGSAPGSTGIRLTSPNTPDFWNHFLNVVALGFGVRQSSTLAGATFLAIGTLPVLFLAATRPTRSRLDWARLAIIAALPAAVGTISFGRASLGVGQSKASHYAEYVLPLIPLAAAAWYELLARWPRLRIAVVAGLWVLLAVTFADDWRWFRVYRYAATERVRALRCLSEYYAGTADAPCEALVPPTFSPELRHLVLDSARSLRASFYRRIETDLAARSPRP